MPQKYSNLAVVVPTHRRTHLLESLLGDLSQQSVLPELCVIVDGSPEHSDVKAMLTGCNKDWPWKVCYVPSNHPNAPYQRYLGGLVAQNYDWVIFFDDDIRIHEKDLVNKLILPFSWKDRFIVGVSSQIKFPLRKSHDKSAFKKYVPGKLTPTGVRIPPLEDGQPYAPVEWLHGGVMAYRTEILLKEMFSPDAFAMSERGYGLGVDDTSLSHSVGFYGEMLLALCIHVEHPDVDQSLVNPTDARQRGFAAAFSRRYLNDHYKPTRSVHYADRLYLLKTYLGNVLISWVRVVASRNIANLEYAIGYTQGAFRGILRSPCAQSLTPRINWRSDADKALSQMENLNALQ